MYGITYRDIGLVWSVVLNTVVLRFVCTSLIDTYLGFRLTDWFDDNQFNSVGTGYRNVKEPRDLILRGAPRVRTTPRTLRSVQSM